MSGSSTNNKKEKPEKKDEQKDEEEDEDLTEEDQKLKEELELLVLRISDPSEGVVKLAINALKSEIRTSTGSMTSVPKPLKFLRPHYDTLKAEYEKLEDPLKAMLGDVLSWLGMTAGFASRDCLRFKLSGTDEEVGVWGHEYVRHLCMEIITEYLQRLDNGEDVKDLDALVVEIVPFLVTHNAEPDACDLLIEVSKLHILLDYVSEANFKRICLYLESCANYLPEPDDRVTLEIAMKIYRKMDLSPQAMKLALALGVAENIETIFECEKDKSMKRQLAMMLGEHGYFALIKEDNFDEDDGMESNDDELDVDDEEEKILLQELMGNVKRSEYFKILGTDLDILEPKLPEDIYKAHLAEKQTAVKADSARQNLARTFVNAFVNAGFSSDKLMSNTSGEGGWLFKNREHGLISAAASMGLIHLWDNANGVNELEKYSALKDENIKAGVMLGVGITNANIRDSFNLPYSFAEDYIKSDSGLVKQCTALALGLAYAATPSNIEVREMLLNVYNDGMPTIELQSHFALALGYLCVGTCDPDLTELFVNTLVERGMLDTLDSKFTRYLSLALGYLYLGRQEEADVVLETLKIVPGVQGKYAALTIETCAYAGTGNVLKIQKMLAVCGEHLEEKDSGHQSIAVLGVALVAMSEPIGRDMVVRSFDHLLQYGDVNIRRAVPLALGILSISNPDLGIMATLSKFSHDHDAETAMGAIFGLGLIGAGTNNARIGQTLRNLASYYHKEANQLFIVRIAQGILHSGKGTMTLNPYHAGGFLLRPAALAGLITTIHSCFDFKGLILEKHHYMLYNLALAMHPRLLLTLNEELEHQPALVRVGQAVDVVGKAGNPKSITGFQTNTSPVLLGFGDQAEIATDEYVPITPILEGPVILLVNKESKKYKRSLEMSGK
jgi:26S proteasome regulatory subunit N1